MYRFETFTIAFCVYHFFLCKMQFNNILTNFKLFINYLHHGLMHTYLQYVAVDKDLIQL